MDDLLWYLEITLDYIKQMLPCMAIAAGCFLALLHHRRRGLYRRGLQSGVVREIGLLAFVLFCAGLAALTVFPSNFWTVSHWQEAFQGLRPFSILDGHPPCSVETDWVRGASTWCWPTP